MERSRKQYTFLVKMSVVDGCFSTENDLLMYIKYRLGLRSRETDSIYLVDCLKLNVSNAQEVFDEITYDPSV